VSAAIVGLDLSLTSPGMAMVDGVEVLKTRVTGVQRLVLIRDWVLEGFGKRSTIAVLEGYSYGSKFTHAHSLGELGGVIKVALAERDIHIDIVDPATLKKFATGKGNAKKPDMLDASRRAGYEGSNDDNAVDVWGLRLLGLAAPGEHGVELHGYRVDVLHTWNHKKEAA
jgi:Holliday junction resolvasome RuvABC endonuclease subunit